MGVVFVQPKVLMAANKAGRGNRSERRRRTRRRRRQRRRRQKGPKRRRRRRQRREMTLTSAIKREKAKLTRKQKGANKMKTRKYKAEGTKGSGKGCFKSLLKLKVHAESCRRKLLKARRHWRLMAQITFKDIAMRLNTTRRHVTSIVLPSCHPFILPSF